MNRIWLCALIVKMYWMKAPELQTKDKLSIVAEEKLQDKFMFRARLRPGHKIWELNLETKELKEAEITRLVLVGNQLSKKSRGRVDIKPNCEYMPALNLKNAEKKFKKKGLL